MTGINNSTADRYRRPVNVRTSPNAARQGPKSDQIRTGAYKQQPPPDYRRQQPRAGTQPGQVSSSRIFDAQLKRDARIHKTVQRHSIKRAFRTSFGVILCFIFGALLLFFMARVFLVVREINIVGLNSYDDTEVIEAGGIKMSGFMYSINKKQAENAITLYCPYVKSVYIDRKLPSMLELTVTEETAVYYTKLCGEYFMLTDELRAVGHAMDKNELDAAGYREIIIPKVTRAIAGRTIQFEDSVSTGYIRNIMKEINNSPLAERVTQVRAGDKFDIYVICNGIYSIYLGDTSDAAIKLSVASKILEDEIFKPGINANIDVSNPKQSRVTVGSY